MTSPSTTQAKAQRDAAEHALETNGNGLLLNDYMNCDGRAAEELLEAERQELDHPSIPAPPAEKVSTPHETARDVKEHELEKNWNGLLWNDYLNCDTSGAQDLWAKEREQLEEVDKTPEAREEK